MSNRTYGKCKLELIFMAAKKTKKAESTIKKLSFFDFLNSINSGPQGEYLMNGCKAHYEEDPGPDAADCAYVPFMVNRGLSYFNDSVLFANEMNRCSHLPQKMQYDFLKNSLRPRKRFSKWFKREDDGEYVELVMKHYGYNSNLARESVSLMPNDELIRLKKLYDPGGKKII